MSLSTGKKSIELSTSQNACDGCTMCCFLPEISELKKPINEWCKFCDIGVGCRIYEKRPQGCRKYTCLYITENLKKELRPDMCHVVFEKLPNCRVYLALVDPDFPDAVNSETVRTQILALLKERYSVVSSAGVGSKKNMFLAEGVTQNEVWSDIAKTYKLMNY